ncbi:hypothetical protein JW851_01200 [Candidatus Woesearchaeota archaeon]|nr:hypothetical protein [Candidatus Woesearchaeota archaeon]
MTYAVECTTCGYEFQAPFKPTPGKIIECPTCLIRYNDMGKSDYMINFLSFLTENIGPVRAVRTKPLEYDILKEAKLICKIIWKAKDKDNLTLPTLAIAQITTKDKSIENIIINFIEENGIEANVPNAPVRKF